MRDKEAVYTIFQCAGFDNFMFGYNLCTTLCNLLICKSKHCAKPISSQQNFSVCFLWKFHGLYNSTFCKSTHYANQKSSLHNFSIFILCITLSTFCKSKHSANQRSSLYNISVFMLCITLYFLSTVQDKEALYIIFQFACLV